MSYTDAHTATNQICIPEVQFEKLPDNHMAQSLRGSAHTYAVFNPNDICVGWILRDNLEF